MSNSPDSAAPPRLPVAGTPPANTASWASCVIACLICAAVVLPIFHAMPSKMKLLGLHSGLMAAFFGLATAVIAEQTQIRSPRLIGSLASGLAVFTFAGLLALGYREMRITSEQPIPLPTLTPSNETVDIVRQLHMRDLLQQAAQPTWQDYLAWRYRPLHLAACWTIPLTVLESVVGVVAAVTTARRVQRRS